MTDESMIRWLQTTFGFNFCSHQKRETNHSRSYIATLHSRKAAALLSAIQPFVRLKRPQLELALQFQADTENFFQVNARKRLPESELARRHRVYEAISALNGRTKGRQIVSP